MRAVRLVTLLLLGIAVLAASPGTVGGPATPLDPSWTPVLPTPGMWHAQLSSGGSSIHALLQNVSDAGASVTLLVRSDDGGETFTVVNQFVDQPALDVTDDALLLRTFDTAQVSTDGGRTLTTPSRLQDARAVALDEDGGVWWAPRSWDACAGGPAYRTSTGLLGGAQRDVLLPEGWRATQSVAPGPGGMVIVVAERCDSGARVLLGSTDDGVSWSELASADDGYETLPIFATAIDWTPHGTAVVEAADGVLVVEPVGTRETNLQVRRATLPAGDALGVSTSSDVVVDIDVAGDIAVITLDGGTVVRGELVGPELRNLEVIRDGFGTVIGQSATVLPDGTILAHVDGIAIERRLP